MKAFAIKEDIYWVGAIDWAVRDFHGYETPRGTSYNNYLIMDEGITCEINRAQSHPHECGYQEILEIARHSYRRAHTQ